MKVAKVESTKDSLEFQPYQFAHLGCDFNAWRQDRERLSENPLAAYRIVGSYDYLREGNIDEN